MGRTNSDRSERRKQTECIQTWVTPEVAEWVTDKAADENISMSHVLRRIVLRAMQEDLAARRAASRSQQDEPPRSSRS